VGERYAIQCECGIYTRRTLEQWLQETEPRCECGKSLVSQQRELFVTMKEQKPADD
jgi:hypothetical protein